MCWTTLWNALTAIGTFGMAGTTYWVIRQNRKFHQDECRPVCALVPVNPADTLDRGTILRTADRRQGLEQDFQIWCAIKNIGNGPALHLRLHVQIPTKKYTANSQDELSPLGPQETFCEKRGFLNMRIQLNIRFNNSDFCAAPTEAWVIYLTYEDVFGNKFYTKHSKNPEQPWALLGNGDPHLARQ